MKHSLARFVTLIASVLLLTCSTATAQRPGGRGGFGGGFGGFGGATVGLLLRDSNAEELKLTDEQKTKIREISDKLREDTRIRDLFGKMRPDSPEEERNAAMAEMAKINAEQRTQSDAELKKLLSPEQFTRYRQMALQSRGVGALADSDVSGDLKLSDEQVAKLKAIGEESSKRTRELMDKMREQGFGRGGEDMRAKFDEIRKEIDDKRLAVLTDAQRTQWTTLKGPEPTAEGEAPRSGSSTSTTASAEPPRRTQSPVNAEAVVSQTGDQPAKPVVSFGKSADEFALARAAALNTAEKPAEENAEPPKPEKVTFNFRHAQWTDVLTKFAELAGLTLDLNVVPPGSFNYLDEKEYTPEQALDVINGYLLQKGYVLVRRDQFLVVVNIDDPIPPNLIPHVKVSDLPKRGQNELMNVVLRVENITAEEAAEEAKELIGPQGKVIPLKRSNAISVTDTGANLQRIHDLLIGLNAAPTDITYKSYDLKHIDSLDAEDKVRAMFGLQRGVESVAEGSRSRSSGYDSRGGDQRDRDGRPIIPVPTTTKPKVQIASNERTNQLLVTANAAEHRIIEDLLKSIDVEEPAGAVRRPRSREPFLHVYQVKTADAQEVAKTLNVLYPGCVVNEDGRARRIHVYATPTQHEQIERMIKQLDGEGVGGGVSVAVVSTGRMDALTAVATLQALYVAERDAAPSITPHPTGYGLIVRGTKDQVDQIKMLISQMDPNALKGDPQKGTLRTIPLGGRDPEEFSQMLKQFWGAKNSTPVIIVPSNTQPIRDRRVPSAIESSEQPTPRETPRPARATSQTPSEESTSKPASAKRKAPKTNSAPITQPRADVGGARLFAASFVTDSDNDGSDDEEAEAPAKPKKKAKKNTKKPNAKKSKKANRKSPPTPNTEAKSNADAKPNVSEPPADVPVAEGQGDPIRVLPSGGNLVITGKDEEKLDEMERLIELMLEATPSKPRWTIFYLRSADAGETASMLERLFPTSSVSSGVSSSGGMLGELTGGISSMSRSLMNATGLSSAMAGSLTLRIIPDVRSNALYVAGPPDQVREVEAMLRVLDASELPEQLRERAPRRIPVEHAEVEEVAAIIREIYKDDMQPEGQQPGQQQNPFAMFMGGGSSRGSSSRGGQQQARAIKLTLSTDARTNTLIVSSSDSLFRQIETLVQSIDDDARAANRTVRVVDVKGSNPAALQMALTAMNSKIKVASSGRTSSSSSSRGSSSSSGSSSSPFGSSGFTPGMGMPFMPPFGGGFPGSPFGSSSGGSSDDRWRFFESRFGSGGSPFGGSSSGRDGR